MQPNDWHLWLQDILLAANRIQRYTADMTFETFSADEMRVDAVLYNLAIIGEAARRVPPQVEQHYLHLPWAEMRGMRNIVVHEYHRVSLPIIWQTVQQNLPPLVPLLRDILGGEP